MSGERVFVRVTLSLFAIVVGVALVPLLLLMKLAEGVQFVWQVTAEIVRQIWSAKGIKEFDHITKP
jgi:hypothetical protein